MQVRALRLPFRSDRSSGIGLPALSTRWRQRQEAELRRPGFWNAGRKVEIPLEPQADILNGQAAPDQKAVPNPTMQTVNRVSEGSIILTLRKLAIFVAATLATVEGPISLGAQSAPAANQPDSVSIQITLPTSNYAIGEKPTAVMTIKNISSNEILFPNDLHHVRIHVDRKDGEPSRSELHRHLRGDFRPGDSSIGLRGGSVVGRFIAPGAVDSQKYDLSAFYDLTKPGAYSVYLEMYDPAGPQDGSGHWLRTNTVKFTIQAPTP